MTTIDRPLAIALLATCLASPAAAQAQNVNSANFLLEHCRRAAADPDRAAEVGAFCMGQIAGIMVLGQFLVPSLRFCPPDGWTRQQGFRVVVAFLDANPQRLHEPFAALALEALRKPWPCKK